jgi:hypothetical protein
MHTSSKFWPVSLTACGRGKGCEDETGQHRVQWRVLLNTGLFKGQTEWLSTSQEGSCSIPFSFHNLYFYRRQQMDGQQLYCQTHVSSQPADPDTGQHKEKLKVLFITSVIQ